MNPYQDYRYSGAPPTPDGRGMRPPPAFESPIGSRLRLFVTLVGVAFAVTLAIVIGDRLSEQAVSILAGAVCGVGASIPTSLLIVWVTRRRQPDLPRPVQQMPGMYPPVVIVQPPAQPGMGGPAQPSGYLSPHAVGGPREFTVVGGGAQEPRAEYYW